MKLPLGRIAQYVNAEGDFAGAAMAQGYSIDSRTGQKGELFFAVKGEKLDGHDYVVSALEGGAVAAVVSQKQLSRFPDKRNLMVVNEDDALPALHMLGAKVRQLWGKKVIGVTGSAGKTTTKEAIAHILATKFNVLKSQGNLNNHFGLPLQLLKLVAEHDVAVIEMGMSHAGEIAALAALAKPDIGVVTNVAPVHLENFDSILGIAKAKRELIESLPSDGIAVLNADDDHVKKFGDGFPGRIIRFGSSQTADVRVKMVEVLGEAGSRFEVICGGDHAIFDFPLMGTHNVHNALAAIAVASCFEIDLVTCAKTLREMKPGDKRGEILHIDGVTILNDCYNSNPVALKTMVNALLATPAKRRIVVVGEMLELGPDADEMHRECGRYIAEKADILIGVRGAAKYIVEAAKNKIAHAEFVESPEAAGIRMAQIMQPGDVMLLKASRGVKLERAIESLQATLKAAHSKSA